MIAAVVANAAQVVAVDHIAEELKFSPNGSAAPSGTSTRASTWSRPASIVGFDVGAGACQSVGGPYCAGPGPLGGIPGGGPIG
jgi:hypothetical protein